jgi:hypothetical protein
MKKRKIFSLFLILLFCLLLVPQVNAGQCLELKYDDGTWEDKTYNLFDEFEFQCGVKFSLPQDWETAKLVMARYYIQDKLTSFEVHVYDTNNNDIIQPFTVTPTSTGWFDVPLNVMVSGDFFIVIEWFERIDPFLGIDTSPSQGSSYWRKPSTQPWKGPAVNVNYMIRAVVCPNPVGGEILSNSISMIGSWLIAGLSIIALTIGVAYRKRKQI